MPGIFGGRGGHYQFMQAMTRPDDIVRGNVWLDKGVKLEELKPELQQKITKHVKHIVEDREKEINETSKPKLRQHTKTTIQDSISDIFEIKLRLSDCEKLRRQAVNKIESKEKERDIENSFISESSTFDNSLNNSSIQEDKNEDKNSKIDNLSLIGEKDIDTFSVSDASKDTASEINGKNDNKEEKNKENIQKNKENSDKNNLKEKDNNKNYNDEDINVKNDDKKNKQKKKKPVAIISGFNSFNLEDLKKSVDDNKAKEEQEKKQKEREEWKKKIEKIEQEIKQREEERKKKELEAEKQQQEQREVIYYKGSSDLKIDGLDNMYHSNDLYDKINNKESDIGLDNINQRYTNCFINI